MGIYGFESLFKEVGEEDNVLKEIFYFNWNRMIIEMEKKKRWVWARL